MHCLLSLLAAWKPHQCTRAWIHWLKPTRGNMFIRNVNELKQHLIKTWSATSLMARLFWYLKAKKQTLWTYAMMCFSVTVVSFKNNSSLTMFDIPAVSDSFKTCVTVMNESTYVLFRKLGWEQPPGKVGNSAAVLLQIYLGICAKVKRFDIVIAKVKRCIFLPHSVVDSVNLKLSSTILLLI